MPFGVAARCERKLRGPKRRGDFDGRVFAGGREAEEGGEEAAPEAGSARDRGAALPARDACRLVRGTDGFGQGAEGRAEDAGEDRVQRLASPLEADGEIGHGGLQLVERNDFQGGCGSGRQGRATQEGADGDRGDEGALAALGQKAPVIAVGGGGDGDGHAADAGAEGGEEVGDKAETADEGKRDGEGDQAAQGGEGGEAIAHDPKLEARAEVDGLRAEMRREEAGVGDLDPPALPVHAAGEGVAAGGGPAGGGGPFARPVERVGAARLAEDRGHDGQSARAAVAGEDGAVDVQGLVGAGERADGGAGDGGDGRKAGDCGAVGCAGLGLQRGDPGAEGGVVG
jgi:hypothetical protein